MTKRSMFFCIIITIGIMLFLVISPEYIITNANRDPYREWRLPEDEAFTGIIDVWHIVGFKAHNGSVSNWLEKRASALEKKHFEVFFEVSAMTLDEYKLRIEQGDRADVYSFPLGLFYQDELLSLGEYELSWSGYDIYEQALYAGQNSAIQYAVPFMYSGYALLINSDMAGERGININADEGFDLQVAVDNMTYETETGETVSGVAGNSHIYAMQSVHGELMSYQDFTEQRASMAIGDIRNVADAVTAFENGRGFQVDAIPVTDYTDLVQFLALDRDIAEEKIAYALELISLALEDEAQSELCDLNAYPVIRSLDDMAFNGIADSVYELLNEPVIPNGFLYKRYKDALDEEAMLAISGDDESRASFMKRIEELTYGDIE